MNLLLWTKLILHSREFCTVYCFMQINFLFHLLCCGYHTKENNRKTKEGARTLDSMTFLPLYPRKNWPEYWPYRMYANAKVKITEATKPFNIFMIFYGRIKIAAYCLLRLEKFEPIDLNGFLCILYLFYYFFFCKKG